MNPIQYFPVEVILTVTADRLLCEMGEVYRICNFLTGDELYTHQLIRAHEICKPWILEQHPQLAAWTDEKINEKNYKEFVAKARTDFGEKLPLTPMPPEMWTHIDPITELQAMTGGKKKIIVVKPED